MTHSNKRAKLIAELEYIIGNECYNGSIQNWGSSGIQYQDGRSFRYPLTMLDQTGQKTKCRTWAKTEPAETFMSGHYSFGANRLDIMRGLDRVLDFLEEHHGLKI